ncbi:MAG: RNA 2',3'-cyclic phosphodiesterase [Pyrinomonadaceae bacterium]
MKRIFIAADISDDARKKAARYVEDLRRAFPNLRVGWERPEKMHVTLRFVGDVNEKVLLEVQRAVEKAANSGGAFSAVLKDTGRFPPKGDPRILWLGTRDNGEMARIASALDRELAPLGFKPEKRLFSPHLTIARLREPRLSAELASLHLQTHFEPVEFTVREIAIYESKLLPTGSVYSKIAAFQT